MRLTGHHRADSTGSKNQFGSDLIHKDRTNAALPLGGGPQEGVSLCPAPNNHIKPTDLRVLPSNQSNTVSSLIGEQKSCQPVGVKSSSSALKRSLRQVWSFILLLLYLLKSEEEEEGGDVTNTETLREQMNIIMR